MNREAYLKRIRYEGRAVADVPTLCAMQRAHIEALPFENLDVVRRYPPLRYRLSVRKDRHQTPWRLLLRAKRAACRAQVRGFDHFGARCGG